MTSSDSSRTDSESCPDWCAATDHLSMKFQTSKGDYFHLSQTIEFPSTDVDHNWHPIFFQLNLAQRMQGDGKFNYVTHPAEVVIGGNGLTRMAPGAWRLC